MINLILPPGQQIDTVELFSFQRQRKLSLRFLASYLLGINIQVGAHEAMARGMDIEGWRFGVSKWEGTLGSDA